MILFVTFSSIVHTKTIETLMKTETFENDDGTNITRKRFLSIQILPLCLLPIIRHEFWHVSSINFINL